MSTATLGSLRETLLDGRNIMGACGATNVEVTVNSPQERAFDNAPYKDNPRLDGRPANARAKWCGGQVF